MEHLIVPTFVIGADAKVLIWNKACERLTGLPAAEVVGTAEHWRAFYAERRPCLSDLLLERRYNDIRALYERGGNYGLSDFGVSAEDWCLMPRVGRRALSGDRRRPDLRRLRRADRGRRNAARHHRPEAGADRSRGAGDPRRADRPRQPTFVRREVRRGGAPRQPRPAAAVAADDRCRLFQALQRQPGPPEGRRVPARHRPPHRRYAVARDGFRRPLRRRGIHRRHAQHAAVGGDADRRAAAQRGRGTAPRARRLARRRASSRCRSAASSAAAATSIRCD